MKQQERTTEYVDDDIRVALQRVAHSMQVPDIDPHREMSLLTAFDAAQRRRQSPRAGYWWMAGVATAAALLIAVGVPPSMSRGRRTPPIDRPGVHQRVNAVGEFVSLPGAAALPPLESGHLVRIRLPVSVLPTLGVMPPLSQRTEVRADVLVGQDGLARAVRLVD